MKKLIATAVLALLIAVPAYSETIKVLIIDESFPKAPEDGEKLAMLDRVNGSLLLGDSNFKGDIEVWKSDKGLYLINEVPLEEYVEGVVKSETGSDWAEEALKAQAVVVRTYVLNKKNNNGDKNFDVTSSVLHQVYKGKNSDGSVSDAVRATEGEILTFEGKPIEAFYHSTCGGKTELPEEVYGTSYPYLKSVKTSCKLSPYSIWVRRIPLQELEQAVGVKGIKAIKIESRTATGRAKEVAFYNGEKKGSSKATDLRKALGWKRLPSTDFSVEVEKDTVVFEGKGYGHGVGLCQWSTLEMAKEGNSYKQMLSHFYPGTILKRL